VVKRAAIPASQVNVFPFAIVATRTEPQLFNDHNPGSKITADALILVC